MRQEENISFVEDTAPTKKKKKEKKKARLGNNKINTLFKYRRPAVKGQSAILPLNCVK